MTTVNNTFPYIENRTERVSERANNTLDYCGWREIRINNNAIWKNVEGPYTSQSRFKE